VRSDQQFESLLYHQKLAHKAWTGKALRHGVRPSDEESELVWELLLGYGEAVPDFDAELENIYKTAYELATEALKKYPIERVSHVFRDFLMDAMLEYVPPEAEGRRGTMVKFANAISSAFCEANADLLRKQIRQSRTETVSREMTLAKRIQTHLLPKVIPAIPGFDFAGRLVPAAEVGGDYWSIKHYKEDGIVTMKVADISGHGIAAATLVAAVKFVSGGYYSSATSAAEVMRKTNRVLTKETPHDVLVTMVYAWLHPDTCVVDVVNAGHAPVFLCHDGVCADISPTGPVLGVTEAADYQEKHYRLIAGDVMFMGSDGITEAGIVEPFGVERLKALVMENYAKSADEIADAVVNSVVDYAGQPHDDISMLVVKVTGEPTKGA